MNTGNQPLLLRPSGKDYLWGGRRLKDEFEKEIDLEPLAETGSVLLTQMGQVTSPVVVFDGMKLADVLQLHPGYLGSGIREKPRFQFLSNLSMRNRISQYKFIQLMHTLRSLKAVSWAKMRCGMCWTRGKGPVWSMG